MKNILHHLKNIKDNRCDKGKRYKLFSIIGLVLIGYMSGCTSLAKIHNFGKNLNNKSRKKLGFKDKIPSHPTITQTMKKIDPEEFEALLSFIVIKNTNIDFKQIAIDGKSIRSTSSSPEGLLHLVSAFAPEVNGVLSQVKSGVGGGEIITAEEIVEKLDIKCKVITGDALFAQERLCKNIVAADGNYVFKVKRNKQQIISDIAAKFKLYKEENRMLDSHETITKGHGRIDSHKIEIMANIGKYFGGWSSSSIRQAGRIIKTTYNIKKGTEKTDTHYIITSLPHADASAKDLLKFAVNHWSIENNLHRTRDTHFKEDICNIICHKSQQINAGLRNLAIFLLSKIHTSIALAIQKITGKLDLAFSLIRRRI